MKNFHTQTLGEIVRHNLKAAAIFERYSLDFCCRGNLKFYDACRSSNMDPSPIAEALTQIESDADDNNFDKWTLSTLIDYICKKHHAYVEEKTPVIKKYLGKVVQVHGRKHPELVEVKKIFFEIGGELAVHMKKEEFMLFPFIKKLERARESKTSVRSPLFDRVKNPVRMMMDDHIAEGQKFRRIARLTNGYQVPDGACGTMVLAYDLLKEYEQDLHMHIHLENNILFPKAIEFEKEVNISGPF